MAIDLTVDRAALVADFGESLRFRANSSATPSNISANVNRQPVEDDSATPQAGSRSPRIHVMVPSGGDAGIDPTTIVEEESEIEVAWAYGGTGRWRVINRILRQNGGFLLLEVMP